VRKQHPPPQDFRDSEVSKVKISTAPEISKNPLIVTLTKVYMVASPVSLSLSLSPPLFPLSCYTEALRLPFYQGKLIISNKFYNGCKGWLVVNIS
jgi:hypothetical protein